MNLSPSWVRRLARQGFEAVHWATIHSPTAPDEQVLSWAREHEFVLITNDLDFSAILVAAGDRAPSVIQLRMQDLLSEQSVDLVVRVLTEYQADIEQGALLSIDEHGARVRILPIRHS